jgi:uncharacterized oxidoreductase
MFETDPRIPADVLQRYGERVMAAVGCSPSVAAEVAEHLVDADLHGVYSHGIFRVIQYAERAREGHYDPAAEPVLTHAEGGAALVDGRRGIGIPAFRMATNVAIETALRDGVAAIGVANVDHTGRLGAFAEAAAQRGCFAVMTGGGARKSAPQVAPYGGARAILPTNPYAFGIPGGAHGPVVIDFATSSAAGGKVYAARESGRPLAEGLCIDAQGRPTIDPADYFNGGALLPMAGPKGYGMALMAELVGEAIMGDAMWGGNWICICINLARFRGPLAYRTAAEQCLAELRSCPPAPGFSSVEIPGEREAALRHNRLALGIPIPPATLGAMCALGMGMGIDVGELQAMREALRV